MITLATATAELDTARAASDGARLARALITWAEIAPAFRYRSAPVRDALVEASKLLPALADPAWEARCLLRLAEVRMEEGILDQAGKLVIEAGARFDALGDGEGVFRAGCLRARILRRTGEADEAGRFLAATTLGAPTFPERKATSAGFIGLMLALGDQQVEAFDPEAITTLRALLNALDEARVEAADARFTAHQGIALVAELTARPDVALTHLRAVTTLVKAHDAPLDLVECRLALGTNLSAAGQMDEARRVLQVVVDSARDIGAEHHRLNALTGLATVLSGKGAVKGAVDLALEAVSGYAQQGNTLGYVRGVTLAAHILLSHQREAGAIELLMTGSSALRHTVGESASRLLDAQIDAIHVSLGEERFERLCQDIVEARAARKRLGEQS
ncbi:MAG: hypothetical protein EXR72_07945 [Myxococcales bacterium]|nr:hypothetical protein [Myxococcales bacterium]